MKEQKAICPLGLVISRCEVAQLLLQEIGPEPFYCEECRFEETIPRLVVGYAQSQDQRVIRLLNQMGLSGVAELLPSVVVDETPSATCSHTNLPIRNACGDKGCPNWIPSDWHLNCVNQFRHVSQLDGALNENHLATIFQSNRKRVRRVLATSKLRAQEVMLSSAVGTGDYNDHPEWVQAIEGRFDRPIEIVLSVMTVDQLVDGYSLLEDQRQYLNTLKEP